MGAVAVSSSRSGTDAISECPGRHVQQLLSWVEKDPSVLERERCREPDFCEALLEHCDNKSLVDPTSGLKLAKIAVKHHARHGDVHLRNRSLGVLAHAYIANERYPAAEATLDDCRDDLLACCPACRSDYYSAPGRPDGRGPPAARGPRGFSPAALWEARNILDDDRMARIRFLRAIAYYQSGEIERCYRRCRTRRSAS